MRTPCDGARENSIFGAMGSRVSNADVIHNCTEMASLDPLRNIAERTVSANPASRPFHRGALGCITASWRAGRGRVRGDCAAMNRVVKPAWLRQSVRVGLSFVQAESKILLLRLPEGVLRRCV